MGYPIIDLHCDSLTEAYKKTGTLWNPKNAEGAGFHFSLDRLPKKSHWCQCMAIFVPDTMRGAAAFDYCCAAHDFYRRQLDVHASILSGVEDLSSVAETMTEKPGTAILTVEGGAALAGDPYNVDRLYAMGVRMMTLTWNGANELGGGAISGGGLTKIGREAVRRMEACGMIVDVSHLSDEGFLELCEFAERPFIASHSNSRSICNHPRNLTDAMFREIIARGGLVGLNYYDSFIKEGGGSRSIIDLVRHVHHFLNLGGADVLALGSDFDGAAIPAYLDGMEKLENLIAALSASGLSDAMLEQILSRNALGFFARFSKDSGSAKQAHTS